MLHKQYFKPNEITIATFLLRSRAIYANAQETKPNLEDTQDWIVSKIFEFSYDTPDTKHTYQIQFVDGKMNIHHNAWLRIAGDIPDEIAVPIKDIQTVFFSDKESTSWLNIRMKAGKTLKFDGSPRSGAELILSKEVNNNNMKSRLVSAFNRLVELNGGKPSNGGKEPF